MLLREVLVLEDQLRTARSVEVGDVGVTGLRDRRERQDVFDIRRTLRQHNLHRQLIHNRRRQPQHNRHLRDIRPRLRIIARRVTERRVPTKRKRVLPAAEDRVARAHLEEGELIGGALGGGGLGRRAQGGGGDVADLVVVVDVADAGGEVECESGDDERVRALEVGLALVVEAGELAFQSVGRRLVCACAEGKVVAHLGPAL